jgi:hypothetical protein
LADSFLPKTIEINISLIESGKMSSESEIDSMMEESLSFQPNPLTMAWTNDSLAWCTFITLCLSILMVFGGITMIACGAVYNLAALWACGIVAVILGLVVCVLELIFYCLDCTVVGCHKGNRLALWVPDSPQA